tara:strand:- start:573 stop:824 length:252 start_codon:yes stop_codon:yes gene_type:complete
VSLDSNVNEEDQLFPEVLDTETLLLSIETPPDEKDTVGVLIVSLAENANVTTSPALAKVLVELFEEILTFVNSADELSYVQLN